jgi:indole-3-glycerol phosphate synthase
METLLLTCLQAQLIVARVHKQYISPQQKNDLIWEIKQISPKECKIDAKAD